MKRRSRLSFRQRSRVGKPADLVTERRPWLLCAMLVSLVVLFQSLLYAAHQRFGIEFGADDLVGAIALDGHAVIADESNMLARDGPS